MNTKKKEGNLLAEIYTVVFENYILCIEFHEIFFVCEYQLKFYYADEKGTFLLKWSENFANYLCHIVFAQFSYIGWLRTFVTQNFAAILLTI
jgi:hypothetical protein